MKRKRELTKKTAEHFNDIAHVWENKIWVNSKDFDQKIINFISPKNWEIAVELGIGTGALSKQLSVKEIYGVDISEKMLEKCSEIPKHRLILGNAENTPFLGSSFDLVLARNLLKHVFNPASVLKEMFRIVKPGGRVVLIESAPIKDSNVGIPTRAVRVVEPYHPPFISHENLVKLVGAAGFKSIKTEIAVLRKKWLGQWCKAKNASLIQRKRIFKLYKEASESFKKDQGVILFEGELEILNNFPWTFLQAKK